MGFQVVLEFSTKMNWNLEIAADGNSEIPAATPGRDHAVGHACCARAFQAVSLVSRRAVWAACASACSGRRLCSATGSDCPPRCSTDELRGIDVTSAGVYRNELVQVFSYPASL